MSAGLLARSLQRPRGLRAQVLLLALSAALLLAVFETSALDLQVSAGFFDPVHGHFPHRHAWLFDTVLHHGLKVLSLTAGIVAVGVAVAGARGAWPCWPRRHALVAALGMVLIPCTTVLIKHLTQRHCPWDLAPFGGFVPYTSLLAGAPAGYAPGQCFPAGHASGGFAWMVWGVALRPLSRRWAWIAGIGGLVLGLVMGVARMAQGAHFLSHTLWSAWLAWAEVVALVAVCRIEPAGATAPEGQAAAGRGRAVTSACS